MRNRLLTALASLALLFGLSLITQPAQAATYGSFKICNSAHSHNYLRVIDTDSSYEAVVWSGCTGWLYPAGIRVVVDPTGNVASFKAMIGTAPTWASRPCHTNDNTYDPPNPTSGQSYEVWVRTYDHGNCTN